MSRSFWMEGIATLTIATSRIVMKNAAPTTARTSHLPRSCPLTIYHPPWSTLPRPTSAPGAGIPDGARGGSRAAVEDGARPATVRDERTHRAQAVGGLLRQVAS